MFGLGRRRHSPSGTTHSRTYHHRRFYRKDRDRVAGGYKAALTNPHTTREGREHAKHELHKMGRSAHVPLMTKIKRSLGMHSTSRRQRQHTSRRHHNRY